MNKKEKASEYMISDYVQTTEYYHHLIQELKQQEQKINYDISNIKESLKLEKKNNTNNRIHSIKRLELQKEMLEYEKENNKISLLINSTINFKTQLNEIEITYDSHCENKSFTLINKIYSLIEQLFLVSDEKNIKRIKNKII